MKTTKILTTLLVVAISATLFSCASKPEAPKETTEKKPAVETPAPAAPVSNPEEDLEYKRSVGNLNVSKETFESDKEAIIRIISELSKIMKNLDYKSWVGYVSSESINYWSQPANLRKAEKRLPIKGLKLTSLNDYFKHVFVPSRAGREVTEIRYISDSEVKAVQVREDPNTKEKQDVIYYYFNKVNGNWMVFIPPIAD